MANFDDPIHRHEVQQLLNKTNKIDAILKIVQGLQTQLNDQNKFITKMAVLVSKLHADGQINNETFDKLDNFLREYYENPYMDDN